MIKNNNISKNPNTIFQLEPYTVAAALVSQQATRHYPVMILQPPDSFD